MADDHGLGTAASRAINLMNQLRSCGIEGDIAIPRIAFAGKQSAGKSSLVEALTGVQLPRNHGTCTRCPIQVTTTYQPSATWTCKISLRLEYDDTTMDLSLIDLPGLIEAADTQEEEKYIDLILALVRDYLSQENTIILQIMQADEDVENQKIRTLAREVDPSGNRSIGVLTKPDKIEADTEGTTIDILLDRKYELRYGYFVVRTPKQAELNNILTAMASKESFDKARDIEQLYFATDPLGKVLNLHASHRCGSENLVQELAKMLRGMIDQQIPAMKAKLEGLLVVTEAACTKAGKSIEKGAARENLIKQSHELECLVISHTEATGDDKGIWHHIDAELQDAAYKIKQAAPLFNINGKLISFETLGAIKTTNAPNLTLKLNKEQLQGSNSVESAVFAIGGAQWKLIYSPVVAGRNAVVKLKCMKLPKGACSVITAYTLSAENAHHPCGDDYTFSLDGSSNGLAISCVGVDGLTLEAEVNIKTYVPDSTHSQDEVLTVDDVEEMINASRGRVLPIPGRPEYDTNVYIMKQAIRQWKDPSISCARRVHDILRHLLSEGPDNLVEKIETLSRFKNMRNSYAKISTDLLLEHSRFTIERVEKLWDMEQYLFTTNVEALLDLRSTLISAIKNEIRQDPKEQFANALNDFSSEIFAKLAAAGITKDHLSILQSRPLCSEKVVETMANAMAVFHLKSNIYADCVCSHILLHLVGDFTNGLGNKLNAKIGAFTKTEDELYHLFSEGADVMKFREELVRKRNRQKAGLELITSYLEFF